VEGIAKWKNDYLAFSSTFESILKFPRFGCTLLVFIIEVLEN
jgi:hypothetical protein